MKHFIKTVFIILFVILIFSSCTSLSVRKSFIVDKSYNEQAWNKANIWVYKDTVLYDFKTTNEYIIQTWKYYIFREPFENNYKYTIEIKDSIYSVENGLLTSVIERDKKKIELEKKLNYKIKNFENYIFDEFSIE